MNKPLRSVFLIIPALFSAFCYAQKPVISYLTPQTYYTDFTVTPLSPGNTGGAVPLPAPITLGSNYANVTAVAVDAAHNVYVIDNLVNSVSKIPADNSGATTISSDFNMPTGIAVDAAGNLYIADFGNGAIKKIPAGSNTPVVLVASAGSPYGIAINAAGDLVFSDRATNTVKKIAKGTTTPVTIGTGFNTPTGIAFDEAGNVLVCDRGNNLIKRIAISGTITTVGPGNGNPNGVACDAAGNIYYADTNNASIIEIIKTSGARVNIGSGFSTPAGVAVNPGGDVYIADAGNHALKVVGIGGYTISPALPAGLTFDTGTGIIFGTPTAASPAKNYTITAKNSSGSSSTILNITVIPPPKPVISYSSPQVYVAGNAITPLSPVNSGGPLKQGAFSVTPALPVGLFFDNNTGTITGKPVLAQIGVDYTITATNPGGSGSTVLNIAVNPPKKPNISYGGGRVYTQAVPAIPLAPINSGGPVAAQTSNLFAVNPVVIFDVVTDNAGNVYIVDGSRNSVKKISPAGGDPTLVASGFSTITGLAIDGTGNLFVADFSAGVIKKIPAGGGTPAVFGSGFTSPQLIATDKAGNVFVIAAHNQLLKLSPDGSQVTSLQNSFGFNLSDLAVDADDNVYATDRSDNTLKELAHNSANVVTVATGFSSPNGISLDDAGNIYVADGSNGMIKRIPAGGGVSVTVVSGINFPYDVAVDANNNLYVSDFVGNLKFVNAGGYFITPALPAGLSFDHNTGVISGTATVPSPATDYTVTAYNAGGSNTVKVNITVNQYPLPQLTYPGPNTYALNKLLAPQLVPVSSGVSPLGSYITTDLLSNADAWKGFAVDTSGNIYVSSFATNTVVKIPAGGGAPVTLASGISSPGAVALDKLNNVYVIDNTNNAIKKIPADGSPVVTIVSGLSFPNALAVDANGNLYTTSSSGVVQKIPAGGGAPITIGPQFQRPNGVAIDAAGNVYITDAFAGSVSKIPVGTSNLAITLGTSFNQPGGIAVDASGNLFFTEEVGSTLKEIQASTNVVSSIGSGLAFATALVVNSKDVIYVAGTGSNISKATPTGGFFINQALPAGLVFDNATGIISGTPTVLSPASDYTVTAYNVGGGSSATVNIAVVHNTALSNLVLSSGTLDPFFDPETTDYATTVPAGTSSIKITPTAFDPTATIAINGSTVGSGTPSDPIALTPGANQVFVKVTAPGGIATQTYTVRVNVISAPIFTYPSPNTYTAGTAIPALSPTNTGSAVPATTYSAVSAFAGSGVAGSANGTGTAATFNGPRDMATDAAGNIYLVDYTANLIRKITPAGVTSTFAGSGATGNTNGTGTAATFNKPAGITIDAAGNLYIADSGNNLIRKITPAGVVTTFAGSGAVGTVNGAGTVARFNNPHAMTIDGSGNLYVSDFAGNTVRKITPAAVVSTFAGSGTAGNANGTGGAASFNGPSGLGADASGNIYVADYTNNLIRKITPSQIVTTFAGSGTAGSTDGTGTAASFKSPYAITIDRQGNVYVAEASNKIRKLTPGQVVTTLAGSGTAGSTNGTGTAATFNDPRGLTISSGNLYVSDFAGHQIRKVALTGYTISPALPANLSMDPTTGIITGTPSTAKAATSYTVTAWNAQGSGTFTISIQVKPSLATPNISYTTPQNYIAGTPITPLSPTNTGGAVPATTYSAVTTLAGSGAAGSTNGTGAAATFNGLRDMATDAAGNVYAVDYTANTIRKITAAGVATTFAGSGTTGSTNGTGTAASFNHPTGVVVDAAGNVYISDSGNNLIRKITPAGVVTTFAGSGAAGTSNGTGTAARFNNPHGLTIDGDGNIYVADFAGNDIRKISPAAVVTTLAGSGTAGNANGTGTAATFSGPSGLAADPSGNIYVADYTNNVIRKITPNGIVTTLAGSGTAGSTDGTGTGASFKSPYSITADLQGNVYVAEASNKIRIITSTGITTTLAGSGTAGSTNGTGTAAKFNDPRGVAINNGNLYVADYAGHQVRKVIITGYAISPILPAGLSFNTTTGAITGTPNTASTATDYTVMAWNTSGGNAAVINITVKAMGGMAMAQPDLTIEDPIAGAPTVKQGVSPNGDGLNDVLLIDNIEKYPDNNLLIMNRSGQLVYQIKGYDNQNKAFNGTSNINGKVQPAGTYFYSLEYKDGTQAKHKTGFILLKY